MSRSKNRKAEFFHFSTRLVVKAATTSSQPPDGWHKSKPSEQREERTLFRQARPRQQPAWGGVALTPRNCVSFAHHFERWSDEAVGGGNGGPRRRGTTTLPLMTRCNTKPRVTPRAMYCTPANNLTRTVIRGYCMPGTGTGTWKRPIPNKHKKLVGSN